MQPAPLAGTIAVIATEWCVADEGETPVQLGCPTCRAAIQCTLAYLRSHRHLWCGSCGGGVRYGLAAVERAEELLRQDRLSRN